MWSDPATIAALAAAAVAVIGAVASLVTSARTSAALTTHQASEDHDWPPADR